MFDQTCTNCGATFSRKANYCPDCGAAASRGSLDCRYCKGEVPASAKFCPHCGKPTEGSQRPSVVGNTWARGPDDFATRVDVDDLEGTLRRDLIVEPGTRAIILIDGRNVAGILGPGRYTLRDLTDKLKLPSLRRKVTVLLVDVGEVDLALSVGDVLTSDPLVISLDCHLAVEIADPLAFLTNLLKGRQSYTRAELEAYLLDEVRDAAQECVGARDAADLHTNLARKQEFATHIAAHLDETLRQTGLSFGRVRTMNYRHARWEELTQQQEEYFLQLTQEEAVLQQRVRMFDVLTRKDVQAIAEETQRIVHFEKRAELRERMRRAVLSDTFAHLTSEQEMRQFLREMDRENLLDDDDWDRIQRTIEWKRDDEIWERTAALEDRDRTRAHLLARLKLEDDYELRQIELLQRADLSEAELDLQLRLERQRVEGEQGTEAARQVFRIEQARQEAEFRREEARLDDIARRERDLADSQNRWAIELGQAKTAADIDRIQREQEKADLELGMLALEKIKAVKRKDDLERSLNELRVAREKSEIELAAEERRLAMQLRADQAAHEREMARQELEQQFELARMENLKDLPPVAVVAATDAERGRIIADMAETEAMRGMAADQILAKFSANDPEAARALAEIAKAGVEGKLGEEQIALYERLLDQNKEFLLQKERDAAQREEAWRASAESTKEIAVKALDSQKDGMVEIARATSREPAQQQPPTVVVTGAGGPQTVSGGTPGTPSGAGVVCRNCNATSPVGTRFCSHCGQEFFSTDKKD